MDVTVSNIYRERKNFSEIKTYLPMPNLIDIQRASYAQFLQMEVAPEDRQDVGLQAAFKSVFDIEDYRGQARLEFVDYSVGNWECKCGHIEGIGNNRIKCEKCKASVYVSDSSDDYVTCDKCGHRNENTITLCPICETPAYMKVVYSVEECEERGLTFSVPIKVKFRLTVYSEPDTTGKKEVVDIKEQELYFGDIPIMTEKGTFIFNGTERVVVNQLNRSPGVFYKYDSEKRSYSLQLIPYRGAWIEFEYEKKNLLYIRIDRKRKFNGATFLRCFGMIDEDYEKVSTFLRKFYIPHKIDISEEETVSLSGSTCIVGKKVAEDVMDASGKKILSSGNKFKKSTLRRAGKEDLMVRFSPDEFDVIRNVEDIVDAESGEMILEANSDITLETIELLKEKGVTEFDVILPEDDVTGPMLSNSFQKDGVESSDDALIELYRKLRPGDPPTLESARKLFLSLCFDSGRYDFSRVGRLKFNTKFKTKIDLDERTLSIDDFIVSLDYFFKLKQNIGHTDDIDHLSNRRVRSVGELLENQFRVGLVRIQKAIREKMSLYDDVEQLMPHELINAKPVMAIIREFFGSSQLSQFMDQTNILSEITHKRRLSSLGPGGLSRERAGFEVRDVHPSHYGRICPIETPEGPNIGLISSLACYAKVNEYGFIETPYKKVENGRILDHVKIIYPGDTKFKVGDIVLREDWMAENESIKKKKKEIAEAEAYAFYLSAWEEDLYKIAQANAPRDDNNYISTKQVNARIAGEFKLIPIEELDYIDVSPKEIVSVAAAMIPFLEHDDANRALMGSNMQRQAVPLMRTEAAVVGTGMEYTVARDSGMTIVAKRSGWVEAVDGARIVVRVDKGTPAGENVGVDIYNLIKFKRSNQDTCFNQKPLVRKGDYVLKGQVIGDGPSTEKGEIALGRNVLVAFVPWRGYNFEDAILVSEKIVKEDVYTSIHVEELNVEARDTKLGPEEITRDIPNVSEEFLKDLDESGIIRIGATIKPGDVLVGKVTPKGETTLTPEEKLLKAIFGAKAEEVKDASLRTPPGMEGTVVDVKIFSRKGIEKDERSKTIEREYVEKLEKNLADEERIIRMQTKARANSLLKGMKFKEDFISEKGELIAKKGDKITTAILEKIGVKDLEFIKTGNAKVEEELISLIEKTNRKIAISRKIFEEEIAKLKKGDELPAGVIKMVKVYIAVKRKLSEGDKMAGRHGNKGVVSKILPEEDMPYLPDGTPVDIVLNPLGVPSRMNVGQILETHLGWAAKALNIHFATPVFDGADIDDIKGYLKQAGLPESGQIKLFDGKTGEAFDQEVTVGYIYMLKLHHLVDNKIHARSIGPYSLITQQPLGGKAQFGGQRFGEMEVWALEAYGAAYTLQEMLTYKSDDVVGRNKIYEAIVKGKEIPEPGIPESFNVLMKEMMSLCLDVQFNSDEQVEDEEGVEDLLSLSGLDANDLNNLAD